MLFFYLLVFVVISLTVPQARTTVNHRSLILTKAQQTRVLAFQYEALSRSQSQ